MKNKTLIKRIIITLVVAIIVFYFSLPALNLSDPSFYTFLLTIFIVYIATGLLDVPRVMRQDFKQLPKNITYCFGVLLGALVLITVVNLIVSPLFSSKAYANRITVNEDTTFTEDIAQVNFNALPLLDKDSSQKLGDRVMGQLPELVSQFYVSDLYTQINYNNDIVRVTPLEYAGFIKYLTNRSEGTKGYITVNSVTGESNLEKLDEGLRYMPSAYFFENLNRYLRFKYPTTIYGDISFEIDNEGNPYWIVSTIKYAGIGKRKEISGAIILDPITGDSKKYDLKDIPTWVDQVFAADLIIDQVDDWGKYQKGFFNALFGQKGVTQTTEGYNYTVMNDDVYLYTGITSVSSDESNIGFILTNLRTKETNFYQIPGAEEYSAMSSAKGQVQQMNYEASFPLLINLNGRPTYLISLKDKAGLVKMYAFVDVVDYQKVVVSDASKGIEAAANNYLNSVDLGSVSEETIYKDIKVSSISPVVVESNTYYYIVDNNGNKYKVSIKVAKNKLPFVKIGDTVNIGYKTESDVIEIIEIK